MKEVVGTAGERWTETAPPQVETDGTDSCEAAAFPKLPALHEQEYDDSRTQPFLRLSRRIDKQFGF